MSQLEDILYVAHSIAEISSSMLVMPMIVMKIYLIRQYYTILLLPCLSHLLWLTCSTASWCGMYLCVGSAVMSLFIWLDKLVSWWTFANFSKYSVIEMCMVLSVWYFSQTCRWHVTLAYNTLVLPKEFYQNRMQIMVRLWHWGIVFTQHSVSVLCDMAAGESQRLYLWEVNFIPFIHYIPDNLISSFGIRVLALVLPLGRLPVDIYPYASGNTLLVLL